MLCRMEKGKSIQRKETGWVGGLVLVENTAPLVASMPQGKP